MLGILVISFCAFSIYVALGDDIFLRNVLKVIDTDLDVTKLSGVNRLCYFFIVFAVGRVMVEVIRCVWRIPGGLLGEFIIVKHFSVFVSMLFPDELRR